jgi:hypothetical protein
MTISTNPDTDRIQELEAKVAELTSLVERLAPAAMPDTVPATATEVDAPATSSRRGMLKLAGAAAVGAAAVAVVGNASPAAAATGNPWNVGTFVNPNVGDITGTIGTVQALADSSTASNGVTGFKGTLVGWNTTTTSSEVHGAVLGLANPFLFTGTNQSSHGVLGVANASGGTGSGVYGVSTSTVVASSAGVRAKSDHGPAVQVVPVFTAAPTTGTWTQGAIVPDTAGHLWYCTVGGTPGTWKDLVNVAPDPIVFPTTGTFTAITPSRVYDSRSPLPSITPLAAGAARTVSIKDKRDLTTGAVVTADIVPAGAKAVTANVTVVNTVGSGFLAVNPGGTVEVSAATVNWFAAGQILNNGVNLTINPATREVTVVAGGSGGAATDFVIDVTGYFL